MRAVPLKRPLDHLESGSTISKRISREPKRLLIEENRFASGGAARWQTAHSAPPARHRWVAPARGRERRRTAKTHSPGVQMNLRTRVSHWRRIARARPRQGGCGQVRTSAILHLHRPKKATRPGGAVARGYVACALIPAPAKRSASKSSKSASTISFVRWRPSLLVRPRISPNHLVG